MQELPSLNGHLRGRHFSVGGGTFRLTPGRHFPMSGPCSRITLFSDLGIRGPLNVEGPWLYPSQHQWRNEGGQGGTFAPGRSTLGAPN